MSKVTEQLYIGNINQASSKEWLHKHHITHVINCTKEVSNFFPNEFVYSNLGMNDIKQQTLSPSVESAYDFMINAMGKGGTVLVHCYAGISRSSSVIIYFLMKFKKWSYDEALDYLRKRHPQAQPNTGFTHQLKSINNKKSSQDSEPTRFYRPPPHNYIQKQLIMK